MTRNNARALAEINCLQRLGQQGFWTSPRHLPSYI